MATKPRRPAPPPPTLLLTSKKLKELATKVQLDAKSRQIQFVEPFPSEVQYDCPICLEILQNPQIIQCCGNRYCLKCLESLRSKKCPMCNKKGIKFISDKKLERLINQRSVFCLLKKEGCSWTGELCKLTDHLDLDGKRNTETCQFLPVQCEHCNEYMSRRNRDIHQSQCNERPSNCTFCGKKVKYNQLKTHHRACPKHPAICPNPECSEAMRVQELANHLSLCPWTRLPCEYERVGCNLKIRRKDMAHHLREDMARHLELATQKVKKLEEEVESKGEISSLARHLELATVKVKKLEEEVESKGEISFLARHLELATVKVKKLEEEVESKGEISFLVISDLPDEALDEHKIKSRFGQFGPVDDVEILYNWNAAIVDFINDETYEVVLEASRNGNIKLCKEYVTATPVYTSEQ